MSGKISNQRVVVIIGAGGIGCAIARRLAGGRRTIFADFSQETLNSAVITFQNEGHNAEGHIVDITNLSSVKHFAQTAATAGPIDSVIHAAGVAPSDDNAQLIIDVDLIGTANVIDAFAEVVGPGSAMVCIASMAGHFVPLKSELELHLATAAAEDLLNHEEMKSLNSAVPSWAYSVAKRANQLRIQGAASTYGKKGARLNSISPGVIQTQAGKKELDSARGAKAMVEVSALQRIGAPDEIAGVAAFLVGQDSSYITGTDILVDGGAFCGRKWGGKS